MSYTCIVTFKLYQEYLEKLIAFLLHVHLDKRKPENLTVQNQGQQDQGNGTVEGKMSSITATL